MEKIARSIVEKKVDERALAIFWLGQASFVFKTDKGKIIYIDPCLTECVEQVYGFKRIMMSVLDPQEVIANFVIITHKHEDHLDVEAIPIIARSCNAKFVGPPECMRKCRELGVSKDRLIEIIEGNEESLDGVRMLAVFADHGKLAPEAIGVILDFQFVRVYVTGDTSHRPEKMHEAISMKPEIIIPVINGEFGNMDSQEAALLTRDVQAKVAIPCHFWMFIEHNGDPKSFVEACRDKAPQAKVILIQQGRACVYRS